MIIHGYYAMGNDGGLYYSTDGLSFNRVAYSAGLFTTSFQTNAFYWRDRKLYSYRAPGGYYRTVSLAYTPNIESNTRGYLNFDTDDYYDCVLDDMDSGIYLYNYSTNTLGVNFWDGNYSHREHSLLYDTYQFYSGARLGFYNNQSHNQFSMSFPNLSRIDSFQFLDSSNRLYITESNLPPYRIKYYEIPKGILSQTSDYRDITSECRLVDTGITTTGKFIQDRLCMGSAGLHIVENASDDSFCKITKFIETDSGLTQGKVIISDRSANSIELIGDYIYLIESFSYEVKAYDVDNLQFRTVSVTGNENGESLGGNIAVDYTPIIK